MKSVIRSVAPNWLWTKLRLWQIDNSINSYPTKQVSHTYGGFDLTVYLADPLAQGWYDCDWPDLPEIFFLRQYRLKPGAKVFDIGAHQGIVAMVQAKIVAEDGFVLAVEANSHNFKVAKRNQELNNLPQLNILFGAVADKSGTLIFNQGLNGQVDDGKGEWGQVEVPAFSIDDLSSQYGFPDVLFIDIEGFECQALQGAKRTLARYPDCFVEVHVQHGLEKFGGSVEEVISFFNQEHYDLFIHSEKYPKLIKFEPHHEILNERFFLTAVSSKNR